MSRLLLLWMLFVLLGLYAWVMAPTTVKVELAGNLPRWAQVTR